MGPAHDCPECMYEEFFLSSWAIGDPAMVVDVPANSPCTESDFDQMGEPTYNNLPPSPCAPGTRSWASRSWTTISCPRG